MHASRNNQGNRVHVAITQLDRETLKKRIHGTIRNLWAKCYDHYAFSVTGDRMQARKRGRGSETTWTGFTSFLTVLKQLK